MLNSNLNSDHEKKKPECSILIADDEYMVRALITDMIKKDGYIITHFDPAESSSELLKKSYDVIIIDIYMPGNDGFQLHAEILKYSPLCQCIMITGNPDMQRVDQSIDAGIFSFLVKPFSADQIRFAVQGAIRKKQLLAPDPIEAIRQKDSVPSLIGSSEHTRSINALIKEIAPLEIPVLITGESGTGKEIVARNIHNSSARSSKTFMAINCGVLPPSLIESELFGHAAGAFTGASKIKHGFFEVADGGTLFLDEIGELPLDLQSRLLRVLDNGEFMRIGETGTRHTDVRIISATNRDLETMRREGRFRDDLFFRLKGCRINLEPLRNRRDDIIPLVKMFLGKTAIMEPGAIGLFLGYDWPGNIRELRMACATIKGRSNERLITQDLIRKTIGIPASASNVITSYNKSKSEILQKFEQEYLSTILQAADGNVTRAAIIADMDRKNLRDKIKHAGLDIK
jgi:two-component system NtrC family response regulator